MTTVTITMPKEHAEYLHTWTGKRARRLGKLTDAKSKLEAELCAKINLHFAAYAALETIKAKVEKKAPAPKKAVVAAGHSTSKPAAAGAKLKSQSATPEKPQAAKSTPKTVTVKDSVTEQKGNSSTIIRAVKPAHVTH